MLKFKFLQNVITFWCKFFFTWNHVGVKHVSTRMSAILFVKQPHLTLHLLIIDVTSHDFWPQAFYETDCKLAKWFHVQFRNTPFTDVHRRLSKYLTAQDTRGTPILTNHNRTLTRLGNILYLKSWSTIKVKRFFFLLSLVLNKFIKKQDIALNWSL